MALTLVEKTAPGLPVWFLGAPKGEAGGKIPVMKVVEVTFDASYVTNGEPFTLAEVGLADVDVAVVSPAAGFVFEYDIANDKIKAFYGNYDGGADGPLVEVANAVNLSTVVTRALIFGYQAA